MVVAEEQGGTVVGRAIAGDRAGRGRREKWGALTPAEGFREFWIPRVSRLLRRVSRKLVSAREISSLSGDRLSPYISELCVVPVSK